jgi:hypothetical protein
MPKKRVILILADGARADVLAELVARGELPAIARVFAAPGTRRTAISGFPSTTITAFLPILTGCFPGTANVPGIRWFDRAAWSGRLAGDGHGKTPFRSYVGLESWRVNTDFGLERPTLFEMLPKSINIFSAVNRGVPAQGNVTALSRLGWWVFAHETHRWDMVAKRGRRHLLASLDSDPGLVFCLIPDIDESAHLTGIRSARTIEAYRRLDRLVADLFDALERRRWRDDTLVMIVSDHGLSDVHTHLGLPEWVGARGMKPFYHPLIWRRRFDCAVMVSGNGMAHIYVQHDRRWTAGRTFDEALMSEHRELLEALVERPEIALTATQRADGAIVVRARHGRATVERLATEEILYRIDGGRDPFGYTGIDGTWQQDRLLAMTVDTRYPDAPLQLLQLFASPRTGDIVVCAEVGYDLRDRHERPEHRAGHGSLHADHMVVPWLSTSPLPDVPLRTADVFPAVLHFTGNPIPPAIDGRDLWARKETPQA